MQLDWQDMYIIYLHNIYIKISENIIYLNIAYPYSNLAFNVGLGKAHRVQGCFGVNSLACRVLQGFCEMLMFADLLSRTARFCVDRIRSLLV